MKRVSNKIKDSVVNYRNAFIFIGITWIFCFFFLWIFIKQSCPDTRPFSPNFCGLTHADLLKVIKSLFELYMPYLGIIVAGLTFYKKIKRIEGWLPIFVLFVSLGFNFIIVYTYVNFMKNINGNDFDVFFEYIQTIKLYPAIFISGLLSYFFTKSQKKKS